MPVKPRISRAFAQTLSQEQLLELAISYANLLSLDQRSAWSTYIVTVMFHHIGGGDENRKQIMQTEVNHVYDVLVSRLFRDPHSPVQYEKLPRWVMFADLSDVAIINGSLHYQGLGIFHPFNRHGEPVEVLVDRFKELLCGDHGLVERVHIERVACTPEEARRYVVKSVLQRKSSLDDTLILPRLREDYRKRGSTKKPVVREPQKLRLPQNINP